MIAIQIKTELVKWVQERLDLDADEAQNFAEEFAGMLYFSGGFSAEEGRLKEAAPALLKALEMADAASTVYDSDELTPLQDEIRKAANAAGVTPSQYVKNAIRAAIAAVRGE